MIIRINDLLSLVMLMGIYNLLCASLFVVMDAMDVALTEAVVGAGISILLLLETLVLTGRYKDRRTHRSVPALILVLVCGSLLIYGTQDLPHFGSISAPIHQHVAPYYLQHSIEETGAANVVTSILASYRGFDTFGELIVIFTACMGVIGVLAVRPSNHSHLEGDVGSMHMHTILRIVVKMLIPLILIFAFYVQFHSDFGPGGGFQAGVIFASAIILYSMVFGSSKAHQVVNLNVIRTLTAIGVFLYGGVGIVSMLKGGNFLDYSALLPEATAGQHIGMLLVELGVGITVASVMIVIYFSFADRVNSKVIGA